jgi:hypothetical protein
VRPTTIPTDALNRWRPKRAPVGRPVEPKEVIMLRLWITLLLACASAFLLASQGSDTAIVAGIASIDAEAV